MTTKGKMTLPVHAGPPEKIDSTTKPKHKISSIFRKRIKQMIVLMAVWGMIPAWVAEWLIKRLGLSHD